MNLTLSGGEKIFGFLPKELLKASLEYSAANPGCFLANVADFALKPLFPPETLNYRVGAAYRVLETLLMEKLVRLEQRETTGSAGMPGTVFGIFAEHSHGINH